MSLNVNNSLGDSLLAALLLLPATHPSTGLLTTIGALMQDTVGEAQKVRIKAFLDMFASEIVAEFVDNAVVTVNMVNHTHSGVTTGVGVSGPPLVTIPPTTETGEID